MDQLIAKYELLHQYFLRKFPHVRDEYQILARLGKISEELGELNSAVHGELGLQRDDKQARHQRQDVEAEWADLFNTVMLFGIVMKIDMPKAIDQRLADIHKRFEIKQESETHES